MSATWCLPARLSGLLSCLLIGLALLWPAACSLGSMFEADPVDPSLLDGSAFLRTLGWAVLVALVSIPLGVAGASALARVIRGGRGAPVALFLVTAPLCVPGYAVFWCWWQFFGPGSTIGALALRMDAAVFLREVVLLVALACWSWPLVTWPLVLSRLHRADSARVLGDLDGAPWHRRLALRWREDRAALLLGCALVAFLTASATVSFDLAQVVTVGFELRALDATGASPGALLRLSLPAVALALAGGLLIPGLLRVTTRRWRSSRALRMDVPSGSARPWMVLGLLAGGTMLVPLGIAILGVRSLDPSLFWTLHATAVLRTLTGALLDGLVGAALAGAIFLQIVHGGRFLRTVGVVFGILWIGAALLPSISISAGLTAAYNGDVLGPFFYDTGLVLLLGHLTRSGGVVSAIAMVAAFIERGSNADARRLDPPRLGGVLPRFRSTMLLAFAVSAVASLGELVMTARLAPPGDGRIATTLLNAMHYQRPDTVLVALAGLVLTGWLLAVLLVRLLPRTSGFPGSLLLILAVLPILPACTEEPAPKTGSVVPSDILVGAPGRGPGLFDFPRGIALDPTRPAFYVVDKTSRIQRFSLDGRYETGWQLPEWRVGRPVGISVAPDGRVFVPDTHYHRIIIYDPEGNELQRFGSFGTGPGEFVYPTDIAFGPDGSLYIAEYGTNDRIQVFDQEGTYLREFGRFGREQDAFARPQSIALSTDRNELYVADTCNHRIGVHALDGTWLRSLAGPGTEPGQLSYPHGLELLPDGTLLVSETGTDRVQRLDALTGASLGTWGTAGFRRGQLRTPWGVASDGERLLVLDSGNARVQIGPLPERLHDRP